ncbi:hypothetical protein DER45DRAFT_531915 [Fusarium avenaceum]|nr:hypothetical protein DER45DRAFT_531915 [Fusarium avenaceum]
MDPLTVDDLSALIEQKPTIKILVKIEKCKVDEFYELMWDSVTWQFLHKVVKLRHDTSVGRALTITQEWARRVLWAMMKSEANESDDDEGQDEVEVEASEGGPTFHGDDLIALFHLPGFLIEGVDGLPHRSQINPTAFYLLLACPYPNPFHHQTMSLVWYFSIDLMPDQPQNRYTPERPAAGDKRRIPRFQNLRTKRRAHTCERELPTIRRTRQPLEELHPWTS